MHTQSIQKTAVCDDAEYFLFCVSSCNEQTQGSTSYSNFPYPMSVKTQTLLSHNGGYNSLNRKNNPDPTSVDPYRTAHGRFPIAAATPNSAIDASRLQSNDLAPIAQKMGSHGAFYLSVKILYPSTLQKFNMSSSFCRIRIFPEKSGWIDRSRALWVLSIQFGTIYAPSPFGYVRAEFAGRGESHYGTL